MHLAQENLVKDWLKYNSSIRQLSKQVGLNRRTVTRAIRGLPLRESSLKKTRAISTESAPLCAPTMSENGRKCTTLCTNHGESAPLVRPESAPLPPDPCAISTESAPPGARFQQKVHHMSDQSKLDRDLQLTLIILTSKLLSELIFKINLNLTLTLCVKRGVRGEIIKNGEIQSSDYEQVSPPEPAQISDSPESTQSLLPGIPAPSVLPKDKNQTPTKPGRKSRVDSSSPSEASEVIAHLVQKRREIGLGGLRDNEPNRNVIRNIMRVLGATTSDWIRVIDFQLADVRDSPEHHRYLSLSTLGRRKNFMRVLEYLEAGVDPRSLRKAGKPKSKMVWQHPEIII